MIYGPHFPSFLPCVLFVCFYRVRQRAYEAKCLLDVGTHALGLACISFDTSMKQQRVCSPHERFFFCHLSVYGGRLSLLSTFCPVSELFALCGKGRWKVFLKQCILLFGVSKRGLQW